MKQFGRIINLQIIKERREFDDRIRKLITNNIIEKENDKY